jgi:hypothetical protein
MGPPGFVFRGYQALAGEEVLDAAGELGLRRGDHARRDFF